MHHMLTRWTLISCALVAAPSIAQQYPSKPVRIIAPFAPGGGTDFIARVAAAKLTETLGQTVIVDNRPGAGGTLGAELGAKAVPDGYTLTLVAGSYAVNPSLYKVNFDSNNDITPIIQLSQGPFLVVVHPALPVKNIKDLITLANKGTGPAWTDTIAGQTQLLFSSIAVAVPQVKNNRLRAIAVTTMKRVDAFPDVPTINESGLKGYETVLWHGLIGPKNLPRPIVDRVNTDLNKILQAKDMQDKLAGDGVTAAGGTPEQFAATIKRDIDTWRKVVQKAGVKAE